MIVFDAIKYFNDLDSNYKINRKFQFQNLEARLSIFLIDNFSVEIRKKLSEYGFDEVVQLEIGNLIDRINNFFFMKEKGINFIGFWKYGENNNIPLIFDIDDILSNDLEYNILKYGKILLRPIEIS